MANVINQKERILSVIRANGPSLPVQIAKSIGLSPLFASAFLSELKADQKIKISNMRVGSSPLYFISGQENALENFVDHLGTREKEAFYLLKGKGVLKDEEQTPVIRVALRSLKDFAIPFKETRENEVKLFWKFFSLSNEEVKTRFDGNQNSSVEEKPKENLVDIQEDEKIKTEEVSDEKIRTEEVSEVPVKVLKESNFGGDLKNFLKKKDIELLETLSEKKKEFVGKIRIDTTFGKQCYYLIAKDKKNVSDNDFVVALQKAQVEKMPAFVIAPGELNKRAKEYISEWGNLVKFEKLEFSELEDAKI